MSLPHSEQNAIKALIEAHELHTVIEAMALICRDRANENREHWQKNTLTAQHWDSAAETLANTADRVSWTL